MIEKTVYGVRRIGVSYVVLSFSGTIIESFQGGRQPRRRSKKIADKITMKFVVDVTFRTGSCLIIQSYSPGDAISIRTDESRWDALPD